MLNNILSVLDKLGFGAQNRAISVQFSNPELNGQVVLQRIEGSHAINDGLSAELICLSTNPYLSLKQFIGCQVAVDQVTDSGQLFRTSGIVTECAQGHSDGALSIYSLRMQDATALWYKRRNSRVFMNKTVIEIVETIFKEWQAKSPLFTASLKLDLSGLIQNYDVRPFSMQSSESDADYVFRLLREAGISWLIDESNYLVASPLHSIEAQKLRLIDDSTQYSALSRRIIRYHRSNATEQFDSITSFVAQRQLQPTAIHVQRWQADALAQEDGAGSVLSSHQHSSQQGNESLSLEQAWHISPAWISDLNGNDQATKSGNAQIEKLNTQLNQYQALQSKYFSAYSSVRDTQVGYWFQLNDHPELDRNHSGQEKEFLILKKCFYNQNNLPKDLKDQLEKLLTQSHWSSSKDSEQERQANELTVIRRSIDVVPEYDPLKHRPTAYVQRAKVVSDGEEIYVDEWGRIKVRFLFTRTDDHSHDGGAGSNDNDTDSAWVDVLTPWAGEGYGARFLPRKDEIVVIDFFDGNIDRPFVTGRIHEADRNPTKFDIKGQLPDTKKLSGIRSKEVDGEGFNQLRFDDTTGQISAQLHSSHGATQLNLGNLSHPKEQAESDGRGEGFELRTDEYGAVRAGKGMLITTYAQEHAVAEHLEAAQAQALLTQGEESMKMLSEIAVKQQTDALNVIQRLPKFIQSIGLKNNNDAVSTTLNLFNNALSSDPITALKSCGGFIEDLQGLNTTTDITSDIEQLVSEDPSVLNNLTSYLENIEQYADEKLQGQLTSLRNSNPASTTDLLKDVAKVLMNVDIQDFDVMSSCGSFSKGNPLKINPASILGSLQGFMEGYTEGLENSSDTTKQEQGKIFRQALMLLASPNGIALTTPEDIILNASQDIAESAQGSINLSAQKNIIGHALDKISLFAAQKGINLFAAKDKIRIQAQDDMIEMIARKVIQIISTEEKIELISAKEINLTSGGTQLKLNSSGIFFKTGGKFESKAGQHKFESGEKVTYQVPQLPNIAVYSNRLDVYDLFWQSDFSHLKYQAFIPETNSYITGQLDEHGRTGKITTADPSQVKILIGSDDEWGMSIEGYDEDDFMDESIGDKDESEG